MILFSQVGEPFYGCRFEKQEWKKGTTLGGFTFPYNVFDSIHGIFRRFALWQSSEGINTPGVIHKPLRRGGNVIYNKCPILVGDMLEDNNKPQSVTFAENRYLRDSCIWEVVAEFGSPPPPQIPEVKTPEMLSDIVKMMHEIKDATVSAFNEIHLSYLPLCVAGPYPINPVPALPTMELIKNTYKSKIDVMIKKLEASLWS